MSKSYFSGIGIVVDAEAGILVTDRSTVPTGNCNLHLTFFNSVKTTASILFLHPFHNFVILQYSTKVVPPSTASRHGVSAVKLLNPYQLTRVTSSRPSNGRAPSQHPHQQQHPQQVTASGANMLTKYRRSSGTFVDEPILPGSQQQEIEGGVVDGSPILLVGLTRDGEPMVRQTAVASITPFFQPQSVPPRFRSMNADQITLVGMENLQSRLQGGVLVHPETGGVYALWCGYHWFHANGETELYFTGMPISYCFPALKVVREYLYGSGVASLSLSSLSSLSSPATSQQHQQQQQQQCPRLEAGGNVVTDYRRTVSTALPPIRLPKVFHSQNKTPQDTSLGIYILDVELWPITLSEARSLGINADWTNRFAQVSSKRSVLQVHQIFLTTPMYEGEAVVAPPAGPSQQYRPLTPPRTLPDNTTYRRGSMDSNNSSMETHASSSSSSLDVQVNSLSDYQLKEGDLILLVQGEMVTSVQDVHRRLSVFVGCHREQSVVWDVLVLRDGEERWCFVPLSKVNVLDAPSAAAGATTTAAGAGASNANQQNPPRHANGSFPALAAVPSELLVGWCGGIMQRPYRAALEQVDPMAHPDIDVTQYPYISSVMCGSPLETDGLFSGHFLLEMDGQTMSAEDGRYPHFARLIRFIQQWKTKHQSGGLNSEFVRLKVLYRKGGVKVLSVRPDEHYWGSWILERGVRREI